MWARVTGSVKQNRSESGGLQPTVIPAAAILLMLASWMIFWSPPLCTLDASDHAEANRLSRELTGRGLSAQGFALMPKIWEVCETLKTSNFEPWARNRRN